MLRIQKVGLLAFIIVSLSSALLSDAALGQENSAPVPSLNMAKSLSVLQSTPGVQSKGVQANTPDISAGVTVPLYRGELEYSLSTTLVDAVYFATMQTGNETLHTFGTITEVGDGTYTYTDDVTDVLRVIFANGVRLEFNIQNLNGDFSQPDGQRFLRKDHVVDYLLKSSTGIDATIALHRQGGAYTNTITGTLTDGIVYSVGTKTEGEVTRDIDPPGVNYESRERNTGTITSDGFSVTLDESFRYHVVIFDNSIEDVERTIANSWSIGGNQFELLNGRVFRTFKNGFAAELDSWNASGRLMKSGEDIGGLEFQQTATTIDTVLTANGKKTVLYSDR